MSLQIYTEDSWICASVWRHVECRGQDVAIRVDRETHRTCKGGAARTGSLRGPQATNVLPENRVVRRSAVKADVPDRRDVAGNSGGGDRLKVDAIKYEGARGVTVAGLPRRWCRSPDQLLLPCARLYPDDSSHSRN